MEHCHGHHSGLGAAATGMCRGGAATGPDIVVEADLGIYDYAALVPVVTGAGGMFTDWEGKPLTRQNHEQSKGRVVAAANKELHQEAMQVLSARYWTPSPPAPPQSAAKAAEATAKVDAAKAAEATVKVDAGISLVDMSSVALGMVLGVGIGLLLAERGLTRRG